MHASHLFELANTMLSVALSSLGDSISRKDVYATAVIIFSTASILFTAHNWLVFKRSRNNKVRLPPGPRALPIVGSLPFLDPSLHICFAKFAKTYGPIVKLKVGGKVWIVVTSPSIAREVLKDHDAIFANRDVPAVGYVASYGGIDMIWSPYGAHLRMLRKVCARELLNSRRLDDLYGLRRRGARSMVSQIYSRAGHPIDSGALVLATMFQLVTSMLWGGSLKEEEWNHISVEFEEVIDELGKLHGEFNISDFLPVLGNIDLQLQGKVRKMKKLLSRADGFLDFIINTSLKRKRDGKLDTDSGKEDFLRVMLDLKEQEEQKTPLSVTYIKALFVDILQVGTRTSATTIEWAMAELMSHPDIMRKVQDELREVVGTNNVVEGSHLHKLSYLNAVVKESWRLHPVIPLLLPRSSSESCIVGGYMIPKGSTVFVNTWAMQRDPQYWDQPLEFKPERFLDLANCYNYIGTDFMYLPFGSGRRLCVGIPLAERMIPYILASLVHSFNWEVPKGTQLDLLEEFSLEIKKKEPLIAVPTPRLCEAKLYT